FASVFHFFFFLFSSRRRHTRSKRDWSSDVCSSDLVKLYSTQFSGDVFLYVIIFFIIYVVILFLISKGVALLQGLNPAKSTTVSNGVIFFNSGNYGVPVNDLVFRGDPLAMSIQVIVLTMQNILTFTYGIFALQSLKIGKLNALLGYFRMPILYALAAAVIMNYFDIPVP